jgi:hypothetical protein
VAFSIALATVVALVIAQATRLLRTCTGDQQGNKHIDVLAEADTDVLAEH